MCDERYYYDFKVNPELHDGDYKSIYNYLYNGTEQLLLNKNLNPQVHFVCPDINEIVNVYQREIILNKKNNIILPLLIILQIIINVCYFVLNK